MHRFLAFVMSLLLLTPLSAEQLRLTATKDTTLYESASGALANGSGDFLFGGRTGQNQNSIRRTLVQFDLDEITSAVSLETAELTLTVSRVSSPFPTEYALHRVLRDWNEGNVNADGNEGSGSPATDGETTWLHRSFPDELWSQPGGDFVATPTDVITIEGVGEYTWGLNDALLADIQTWISEPSTNFGWAIIGGEATPRTSRQFQSRSAVDIATRPTLSFDIVPECPISADIDGDLTVGFSDFLILSGNFGTQVASGTLGDLDCNGAVEFADFLTLSAQFGNVTTAVSSVPEPASNASCAVLGLAVVHLVRRRRRTCE